MEMSLLERQHQQQHGSSFNMGFGGETVGLSTISMVGRESLNKRKAEQLQIPKSFGAEDNNIDSKRIKGEVKEVNNINHNREATADASNVQKPDYIHVRARRGQATDSHSLAERVRREKISERMRYLQDLVPGCNKIIGKAGMLDEIINYVQSLQSQVEFLSMKLATVIDHSSSSSSSVDSFFPKEMFQSCGDHFSAIEMLSEVINPAYYPFNPLQQVVSSGVLDEINHTPMCIERTTSDLVSMPAEYLESSCFTQAEPPAWDDLQSLYRMGLQQGKSPAFSSEPDTGNLAARNLKTGI